MAQFPPEADPPWAGAKHMYTVYILKSLKNNKRYTGSTAKEAIIRLKEHNDGTNKWTKQNGPFKLLHTEPYETKKEALQRENFLKSGQGRKWLDDNNIK